MLITKSPASWRGFRSSVSVAASVAVLAVLAVLAALAGSILLLLLTGLLPAALLLLARLLLAAALLLAALLIALLLLTGPLIGILVLVHSLSFQRWYEDIAAPRPRLKQRPGSTFRSLCAARMEPSARMQVPPRARHRSRVTSSRNGCVSSLSIRHSAPSRNIGRPMLMACSPAEGLAR